MSRRHAEVEPTDEGYVVTDAGSLNGTYVNQERIDRAVLHHGDELQVGKFRLVFFERSDGLRPAATAHLSIGEVLGLLLEEFPDVTISKIRFLESQGLIEPERTPSGYRKFYDDDVELLRVILREQRENFLPLRVIQDRLETGADRDPTGPTTHREAGRAAPAAHARCPAIPPPTRWSRRGAEQQAEQARAGRDAHRRPGCCRACSSTATSCARWPAVTTAELAQLEAYGVVARRTSAATLYSEEAVAIAAAAAGFMRAGVEARHLRAWRTSGRARGRRCSSS